MREQGYVGIVQSVQDPLGLLRPAQAEPGVDRRDDEVETRKRAVGQIEGAVVQDVDFDALEQTNAFEPSIEAVDGMGLLEQPLGIEPMTSSLGGGNAR